MNVDNLTERQLRTILEAAKNDRMDLILELSKHLLRGRATTLLRARIANRDSIIKRCQDRVNAIKK